MSALVSALDSPGLLWHRARVEELFARKRPRSRIRLLGCAAFVLLGGVSVVDAIRDTPMVLGGRVGEPLAERMGYRVGAAFFCLAIAALSWPGRGPSTGDRERL